MSSADLNPYAAPTAVGSPPALPSPQSNNEVYRDGIYLIARNGSELPHRCAVTNEPIEGKGWRKKVMFTWSPAWALALVIPGFLLGLIPGLILAAILQKRARITYSLSPRSRWKKTGTELAGVVMALIAIGLIIAMIALSPGSEVVSPTIFAAAILLIGCLVTFVISAPLKATKAKKGWFKIKGCSPELLATLPPLPLSPF